MEKEIYDKIRLEIIKELVSTNFFESEPIEEGVEPLRSDVGDIGNLIGIAVGEFIVENGWDKNDFIFGIEHGISLKDGTH